MRQERQQQQQRGPRTRKRRRPTLAPNPASAEKTFAAQQVADLSSFASTFNWSPWREGTGRTEEGGEKPDATQLKRWRLKCDMLRVATYYRVTGAHARAHKAKRRAALQARLRAWAKSMKTTGQGGPQAGGKRPPTYSETRPYKKRATAAEMTARRLTAGRRRLGPTAASTEVNKRLRDDMTEIARRCVRQRRDRFGDG